MKHQKHGSRFQIRHVSTDGYGHTQYRVIDTTTGEYVSARQNYTGALGDYHELNKRQPRRQKVNPKQ